MVTFLVITADVRGPWISLPGRSAPGFGHRL